MSRIFDALQRSMTEGDGLEFPFNPSERAHGRFGVRRRQVVRTLDPTTRGFAHEGRRYLVTDTVGFIRRLPHQLVEGFAATLEETLDVRPRPARRRRIGLGRATGRHDRRRRGRARRDRRLRASRRARPEQDRRRRSPEAPPPRQPVPGRGRGLGAHRRRTRRAQGPHRKRFAERLRPVRLLVPYDEGRILAELYELGAPIDERLDTPEGVVIWPSSRSERCLASPRTSSPSPRSTRRAAGDRARDPAAPRGRARSRTGPTMGMPASTSPRATRSGSAPASARSSERGSRLRSPRGMQASSNRGRALRPGTGSRSSTRRA